MKDFADVPNSDGTFPDVIAFDCSGPGETDGTALIADTLTDDWGWKQALLNDQGVTPNDVAESASASQILEALKTLIQDGIGSDIILPCSGASDLSSAGVADWFLVGATQIWQSRVNAGKISFSLRFPLGYMAKTVYVDILVDPGAARSTSNRMFFSLYSFTHGVLPTISQLATAYDDSSANLQTVTLSTAITTASDVGFFLTVNAGNDGAANQDKIYAVRTRIA